MGKGRAAVGIVLTAIYLIAMSVLLLDQWPAAKNMPPNNWGDYLAGAFAPLAFLWLVLGYFQQGDELRQNTEALQLQAEQLRQQVEETKLLVQEAAAQAKASAEAAAHQAALVAQEEGKAIARFGKLAIDRKPNQPNRLAVEFQNVGQAIANMEIVNVATGVETKFKSCDVMPANFATTSQMLRIRLWFDGNAPQDLEFTMRYSDVLGTVRFTTFSIKNDRGEITSHGVRDK